MSTSSNATSLCDLSDKLCVVLKYELEVIVIPVILLAIFVFTLLTICLLRVCHKEETHKVEVHTHHMHSAHKNTDHAHKNTHHAHRNTHHAHGNTHHAHGHTHSQNHTQRHHQHSQKSQKGRRHVQGIDAPPELNPLEYEVVAMTPQAQRHEPKANPTVPAPSTQHDSLQLISPLPLSFAVKPDDSVTLYRATMDRRPVILRVLKDTANAREHQTFLDFARFLSELGSHPSIPKLLGAVTVRVPLIIVMEELENRDLLGFLWRCRQDNLGSTAPCDMTEKRIFTMGIQIASALDHLHRGNCLHGNMGARSVLVGQDLSVKLWGLGPAFRRRTEVRSPGEIEDMEMRKWQAPEVLARQPATPSSDIWSFGILLYEMVTLGEPPFPRIMASELLQYLQRGKTLKRPPNCSNSVYSIIKACCQWAPQDRPSLTEVVSKLQAGERTANDTAVIQVPEALDIEKYMREAGYGEAYNYAIL